MDKFIYWIIFLLLLMLFQITRAEGLLRLFTTAQERAALNAERSKLRLQPTPSTIKSDQPITPITPVEKLPHLPRYITFNGLVIRPQGQPIVWINGHHGLSQQGFTVELDKITDELSVPVVLSHSKQRFWLKPGQTVDTLNGTIMEDFVETP